MDESKKLTRTAIISFVIATLCYTIMWFMMRSAEKKFFGDYIGGTSGSGTAVQILVSVLAGVILFLLPLEKIGQKACAAMEYCGSLMTIGKKARHEAAVVMTVIFYVVICWLSAAYHIHANIEYNSSGRYGSFGADSAYIYAAVMTVLAFAVLLVGVDAAQTRWFRLIYWAAVTFANITSVYIVTGGRDLVIGIVVSEFVMYIVYMAATGELKLSNGLVSLIYSVVLVLAGYTGMFTGNAASGNDLMDKIKNTGEIPNEFFENIYDLTIIKDQFGTSGIIAWFAVFVVFSASVIITFHKTYEKRN